MTRRELISEINNKVFNAFKEEDFINVSLESKDGYVYMIQKEDGETVVKVDHGDNRSSTKELLQFMAYLTTQELKKFNKEF